jgi:hypothetical protein
MWQGFLTGIYFMFLILTFWLEAVRDPKWPIALAPDHPLWPVSLAEVRPVRSEVSTLQRARGQS